MVVQPGTLIASRYKVANEIGRGGMGVVYRVDDVHSRESFALKALLGAARFDPQATARFKREARASARIRSDYVVRVIDADTGPELEGSPFIVMELLQGSDLEQHIACQGPLAPELLIPVLTQVAEALELAHQLGIVHRDLKPENLFLHECADGTVMAKILDFGISKFISEEVDVANKTSTGSVVGTPFFMSPEQARGENDRVTPTTDVWAMGLVALRLLTGEHYWGVSTMPELMMKIAVTEMIPPSERWPNGKHMSPALDAWFLRSCEREQQKRWPSVPVQMMELASVFGIQTSSVALRASSFPQAFVRQPREQSRLALADREKIRPMPDDARELEASAESRAAELRPSRVPLAPPGTSQESQPTLPLWKVKKPWARRWPVTPLQSLALGGLLGTVGALSFQQVRPLMSRDPQPAMAATGPSTIAIAVSEPNVPLDAGTETKRASSEAPALLSSSAWQLPAPPPGHPVGSPLSARVSAPSMTSGETASSGAHKLSVVRDGCVHAAAIEPNRYIQKPNTVENDSEKAAAIRGERGVPCAGEVPQSRPAHVPSPPATKPSLPNAVLPTIAMDAFDSPEVVPKRPVRPIDERL